MTHLPWLSRDRGSRVDRLRHPSKCAARQIRAVSFFFQSPITSSMMQVDMFFDKIKFIFIQSKSEKTNDKVAFFEAD